MTDFENGVISMAHNCQAMLQLVEQGRWTLGDAHRWLDAVINQDAEYLATASKAVAEKLKDGGALPGAG